MKTRIALAFLFVSLAALGLVRRPTSDHAQVVVVSSQRITHAALSARYQILYLAQRGIGHNAAHAWIIGIIDLFNLTGKEQHGRHQRQEKSCLDGM